ncbi:hypothetical protein [Acidithiobacillus sp.]|uniref:hypothetical protein n=1 Tax=Acidithiobacillus sp. TaxID=1872118 RepID=UPI003CFF0AC3
MKITDSLAITFKIGDKDAYSTPLSKEAFEASYRLIAGTKAALFDTTDKALVLDGPALALLTLKDVGATQARKREEDGDGGAAALIAELGRLTMVVVPGAEGLDLMPVSASGVDPDEWEEALSALIFFTVNYALTPKSEKNRKIEMLSAILNFGITSQSAEDWLNSLKTSTAPATPAKKAASSVPV